MPRPSSAHTPRRVALAAAWLAAVACSRSGGPHGHAPPASDTPLARVAAIHGAPGPFAVAGWRIGQRALRELGLPAGTFDLDVRHESPAEVQWSCIADGVQASTGVSAGKLNLHLHEVPREALRTVVKQKSTGKTLAFRLTPTFAKRFLDLPRSELARAGETVLGLPDEEIFTVEPTGP